MMQQSNIACGNFSSPQQKVQIGPIIDNQIVDNRNITINTPQNPYELLTLFHEACHKQANEDKINVMIQHERYTPQILGTFLVGEMGRSGWTEGSVAHKLLNNSKFTTKALDAAYMIADCYADRLRNGQQICETLIKHGVRNWRCESVVEYSAPPKIGT